jgi:hypothetical protein
MENRMDFIDFIKHNLINTNGNFSHVALKGVWTGFELEQSEYKKYGKRWLYDKYHNITSPLLCECGGELKFYNFKHGYRGCSNGDKCAVRRYKLSMANRKVVYDIDWFYHRFEQSIVNENIQEFNNVILFLNKNKIRMSKKLFILKWIENYIKFGISAWDIRIETTLSAIKNGLLNPKDVFSDQSIRIRYGDDKVESVLSYRKSKLCYSWLDRIKKKCGEDESKIEEMMKERKLKSGHTIESYIFRHGPEKGPILYKKYWDNTTFALTKKRCKKKYGDNWEDYYNSRIDLHRSVNLKNLIYERSDKNISEEEFIKRKKSRYKKASYSKSKKRLLEIYSSDYVDELSKRRWGRGLGFYIKKYGDEEGRKKYKESLDKRFSFSLSQCIMRWGFEIGTKKFNEFKAKSNPNKQTFVKKYGKKIGIDKYNEFKQKMIQVYSKIKCGVSNESNTFIKKLIQKMKDNEIDVGFYYFNDNEKCFYDSENKKTYFVDLYFEKYNVAFEYNGIAFHPNPNWDIKTLNKWKHPYSKNGYSKVLKYDNKKINFLKTKVKEIFVLFSDEDQISFINQFINYIKRENENVL